MLKQDTSTTDKVEADTLEELLEIYSFEDCVTVLTQS